MGKRRPRRVVPQVPRWHWQLCAEFLSRHQRANFSRRTPFNWARGKWKWARVARGEAYAGSQ